MDAVLFQDLDQPLLGDDAVQSGDFSGIDDLEFLNWLIWRGGGSTATSPIQPQLSTTIVNGVGFPAGYHLSQFHLSTPTHHTPVENDVTQSLRPIDQVSSVAHPSSLALRAWLTIPHAPWEYMSDRSEPIAFENATDTQIHLRSDATSPTNPRENTELSALNDIKLSNEDVGSNLDPEVRPQPTKRTFVCKGECGVENCKARYKSRGGYYRHRVSEEKRRANCKICGKTMTRWNLARHKRNICPTPRSRHSKPAQNIRVRATRDHGNQAGSINVIPTPLNWQHIDSAKSVDGMDPTSVYLRALNAKQPRIGQRGKFDLEGLQAAFPDRLGLKMLLESILSSPWYYEDELEPRIDSSIGKQLLDSILQVASDDEEFCTRVETMLRLPEEEKRNISIYELFKESRTGNCLFCNAAKRRQEFFLSHIRSHLEHRPYGCEVGIGVGAACKVCDKEGIGGRFYSSKLLQEHQGKATKRVICNKCRTSVQKGGAIRHLRAVHKTTTENWSQYFTTIEPSTPISP